MGGVRLASIYCVLCLRCQGTPGLGKSIRELVSITKVRWPVTKTDYDRGYDSIERPHLPADCS